MSKYYSKTYRIDDYDNEADWLTKTIHPEDDYLYDNRLDPYTYTVQVPYNPPSPPPPQQQQQQTSQNAYNSTYLPWYPSTSNVLNGIGEGYAVAGGLSKKDADSISSQEFNRLENFGSPADVADQGIFVPGKLYRFNNEKETTYQYVVLMEDVEKDGTTIVLDARDKQTFEGKVFLCLETRWVDGPVTTIVRKGVTKFVDRLWQTVFLSGSKTYTFYWFENPREAEHYGNVQACAKFWQAHLGVLLKGLAGNIGNAVGLSVASNILSYPNTYSPPATTTTTLNPANGITTTSITSTWGWSGQAITTPATVTVVPTSPANKIPSEESFFAMPSREMFIRIT